MGWACGTYGKKRNMYVLMEKLEGKRSHARHKPRREDNIQ
jgi:hypothetical protein